MLASVNIAVNEITTDYIDWFVSYSIRSMYLEFTEGLFVNRDDTRSIS